MVLSLLSPVVPAVIPAVLSADFPVGQYVSWWKCIPLLIVMLLWGRLITWIDKDAPEVLLPRVPLNVGNLLGGILGFFLFFTLPGFAVAMIALVVIVMVEAAVYLAMRNQKVGLKDLNTQFMDWLGSFRGEKQVKIIQGAVQLISKNGSLMAAPAAEDPILPAYETVQTLLTDPLRRNAERIDLAPVDGVPQVRYTVDGVSYAGSGIERGRAAAAIEYLKSIAGMDLNEKRKPQSGSMRVSLDGQKRELQIQTAGSSAGEQLRALVDPKKRFQHRLEDLGMPEDQLEMMKALIHENTGLVLVSTPRGQGLTTLLYAILRAHDAFLQHLQTIESEPATDLEGITQNKIASPPTAADELKTVAWVISQEPDVLMVSSLQDSKAAIQIAKYAGEEKRIYVGMRANSTFEAMAAWRKLVGDEWMAVKNLRMVINGRVLRKLCAACKSGYTPEPGTLRRLNMDPDKVGKLYQARTQPIRDPKGNPIPCDFCKELYFKGRMGVYEMLLVDDDVRGVMEAGGSLNQLKGVFRKQRGKYLQEVALSQVEAGETSVQEVLRVMKTDDKPSPSAPSGAKSVPRRPAE